MTLGIFWFVVNALMLKLAASLVSGFTIQGFLPAFFGAIVLSIVNVFMRLVTKRLSTKRHDVD
jgi:putative membrane protein